VCSRPLCVSGASCMNREITDKIIVYSRNTEIRQVTFGFLISMMSSCLRLDVHRSPVIVHFICARCESQWFFQNEKFRLVFNGFLLSIVYCIVLL